MCWDDARATAIATALGNYKFFVHADHPAIDNLTTNLALPPIRPQYSRKPGFPRAERANLFPEYSAATWLHRALLANERRTYDWRAAELIVCPAYLPISAVQKAKGGRAVALQRHADRISAWIEYITVHGAFKRHAGADHLFLSSDIQAEGGMRTHGFDRVAAALGNGYTAAFESNKAWTGGWELERAIVVPYVANRFLTGAAAGPSPRQPSDAQTSSSSTQPSPVAVNSDSDHSDHRDRNLSFFYVAAARTSGASKSHCDRSIVAPIASLQHTGLPGAQARLPALVAITGGGSDARDRRSRTATITTRIGAAANASIVTSPSPPKSTVSPAEYASNMRRAIWCPLTCGDTPTSRRTFDAVLAGCVPIIVGERLLGLAYSESGGATWLSRFISRVISRVRRRGPRAGARRTPPYAHLPFDTEWLDWSVYPQVSEAALARAKAANDPERARSLFAAAVHRAATSAAANAATRPTRTSYGDGNGKGVRRLQACVARDSPMRRSLTYGYGDYRQSNQFGEVATRLVEAAILRLHARREREKGKGWFPSFRG